MELLGIRSTWCEPVDCVFCIIPHSSPQFVSMIKFALLQHTPNMATVTTVENDVTVAPLQQHTMTKIQNEIPK